MYDERLHVVIVALIQCAKITESTAKWSESRRDALKALTSVCHTVFSEKDVQTGKFQLSQFCCYFCVCKLGGRGGILHHTLYTSCKVKKKQIWCVCVCVCVCVRARVRVRACVSLSLSLSHTKRELRTGCTYIQGEEVLAPGDCDM